MKKGGQKPPFFIITMHLQGKYFLLKSSIRNFKSCKKVNTPLTKRTDSSTFFNYLLNGSGLTLLLFYLN